MDKQPTRYTVAFLLVAAVLLIFSKSSLACQCIGPQNLSERVARSDVVLVATITSVEDPGSSSKYRKIGYQSIEILKGKAEFVVLQTSRTSCGIPFEVGTEYLVFATSEGAANNCSGTRPTSSADGTISQGSMWANSIRDFNAGITTDLVAPWYFHGSEDKCILSGEFIASDPSHLAYIIVWASRPNSQKAGPNMVYLGFSTEVLNEDTVTVRPVELHIGREKIEIPPPKHRQSMAQARKQVSREKLERIATALREASTDPGGSIARVDTGSAPIRMSADAREDGAISQFQKCVRSN